MIGQRFGRGFLVERFLDRCDVCRLLRYRGARNDFPGTDDARGQALATRHSFQLTGIGFGGKLGELETDRAGASVCLTEDSRTVFRRACGFGFENFRPQDTARGILLLRSYY